MDNSNNEVYTIGTCKEMCPFREARLRERQGLLHILEVVPGTENNKNPKADVKRVVKEFTRSAAGKSFLISGNLRPPDVLLKTINYLLDEVISNKEVPWMVKYDFILDRLRAVRQDMVIQNVSRPHQIVILQPIIRFLTYSSYRCCEEAINTYDPHINNTHLQECLKRLLCTYDYFDNLEKSSKQEISNNFLVESRPYFESLYLIFNMGDVSALNRYLNLPPQWRTSLVKTSMRICLNYVNRNISKVIKLSKQLPLSLQMIAFLHLPEIRRITLKIMSSAYHSKNLRFPLDVLSDMLLYNSVNELIKDCNYYGLKTEQGGVHFMKCDFLEDKVKMKPRRSKEIDKTLEDTDISMFLLYGDN
ncbi:SAC3 domain-containing protein 1 [Diabrotica virgifera virgifera]|uniref:SAC3 domain-containing protein 1 n=1 Tax=Diabrotica virgifera virgifera TaxID=50390 RepID=A0A6P7FVL3_DIAVI|nr:SAC3 domain-containing protein 1 [Diabrotica virgifera virgifera]